MATATLIPTNAQERTLMAELDNICKEFASNIRHELCPWFSDDMKAWVEYYSADSLFHCETTISATFYKDKYDDMRARASVDDLEFCFVNEDGADLPNEIRPEFERNYFLALYNKLSKLV
ncbi:MAG: hypothetical protein K2K08_08605 [Paramuribaculum sp.]|nr:hypothetical protein [Paramuribaculum sp.]